MTTDYERGYEDALRDAHVIAGSALIEAADVHKRIRATLFGGTTKAHHEWLGYGRAARAIGDSIFALRKR